MTRVLGKNEIALNSVHYPIIGKVKPTLVSTFPGKVVIGDYSKETEQVGSSWIVSDQRGGILIEEMDEATENDRAWWSTCNLSYKGHIVLPPLVTVMTVPVAPTAPTITDGGLEAWDNGTLTNWTESGDAGLAKYDVTKNEGDWCAYMGGTAEIAYIYQDVDSTNDYAGMEVTFTAYGYSVVASRYRIGINDGVTTTYSDYIAGDSAFHLATHTKTLSVAATRVRLICQKATTNADVGLFDGAMTCTVTAPTIGNPGPAVMYNSILYYAFGRVLAKENAAGTGFDYVAYMPATITDLKRGVGNNLYIAQGDSTAYIYMNTSEVFVLVDNTGNENGGTGDVYHNFFIYWDSKLFGIDTAGQLSHAATPNAASPVWTKNGDLVDAGLVAGDVQSLRTGRDADGTLIIYAGTLKGYWAHDYTNAKWLETELSFPDHPSGGKGLCRWRDAIYISAGLDIHKYIAARTATITQVGLDRDDGLPNEYAGEITSMTPAYNEFFALVDSSLVTGTGYSTVMAHDGHGWQCRWLAATADDVMNHGVVASDISYRYYFNHDNKAYYMALERNIRNPKKISSYPYEASSIHITPWFDGGWANLDKLALAFKVFCKDTTAAETVTVSYRIDHATTNIGSVGTEWTELGEIVAAGDGVETEYTFASELGAAFKAIQFRFDLIRGDTNTLSPDIQWYALKYMKRLSASWGWQMTLDCTRRFDGRSPKQLLDAIETVVDTATTTTLVPFTFRNDDGGSDTFYVLIRSLTSLQHTGTDERGIYMLNVVAP